MTISGNYKVVLDSCVLLPPSVCDLFLRLAETPKLYEPKWTGSILEEVRRNQIGKFSYPEDLADYWRSEVTRSFPGALVEDYEPFIEKCQNEEKDRHVLAAAIRGNVDSIITFNLKHFPKFALAPWNIKAVDPAAFVLCLYEMKPAIVLSKLDDMSADRNRARVETLSVLQKTIPSFVNRIVTELEISLPLPIAK
jgi:hypothetical protein